jgi:probable rRNA maturation factor
LSGISYFFEETKPVRLHKKLLIKHIDFLLKNEQKVRGDISIIICSDSYLLNMNREYLQHDYYTDIITFDYSEGSVVSGDLFISTDRVKENAAEFGVSFYLELYRVIFHGLLHLVGYKDKTKEERQLMRDKESYYVKGIDFDKEDV